MSKPSGTQSITRAIQLLKLFSDERPEWTLLELIDASGLKKTTVFRMLAALEEEGLLERTTAGEYCLGAEMIVLGGRAQRRHHVRLLARPWLTQLARQTTESTTLDVLWQEDAGLPSSMVIDEVPGRHLLGMTQYVGVRFPAHATSTGKVLLAFQPDAVLDDWLPSRLQPFTEHTLVSAEALRDELEQIREQGYAISYNELEIGICAAAAPILNQHGEIRAALSVGGASSRIARPKLIELAQLARAQAAEISAQIGYRPFVPNKQI